MLLVILRTLKTVIVSIEHKMVESVVGVKQSVQIRHSS